MRGREREEGEPWDTRKRCDSIVNTKSEVKSKDSHSYLPLCSIDHSLQWMEGGGRDYLKSMHSIETFKSEV